MASLPARFLCWTQRQARRPRRWMVCLLVPLADYIIPVLPANTLLMSLGAGHPKRWRRFAIAFALANAVGAAIIALLLGVFGMAVLTALFGEITERPVWSKAETWINAYGLLVLIPLSILLFPPRVAVVVAGLAGLNPLAIGASVFAGRMLPMVGFAWLGARSPRWARRFGPTRRLLEEMDHMSKTDPPPPAVAPPVK